MRWIVGMRRAIIGAAVVLVLAAGGALAQGVTTGAITGKVTDPQGQPVAEAAVQVTNRGTGYTTTVRTRSNGQFLLQGLEVGGPYTVSIRAIGFQPFSRDNVAVGLSEATRVDAQLTAQAVELLHGGAPGIHFYTLNQSPATRIILTALKTARLA